MLGPLQLQKYGPQVQKNPAPWQETKRPGVTHAIATGMLVHIQDQLTDRRYLVDRGTSFSLIPHKSSKTPATKPRMIGPNGHPIQCLGEECQRLSFSGCTFERLFLRTDISFPILGVDFLRANKLSVSVASNQLVDDTTGDMFSLSRQPSSHTA